MIIRLLSRVSRQRLGRLLVIPASIYVFKYSIVHNDVGFVTSPAVIAAGPTITPIPPQHRSTWKAYISEMMKAIISKLKKYWRILQRSTYLALVYVPALITSPILIIANDSITEWWWGLFKSCIISSGPCSLKFAQWIATRPDLFPVTLCDQLKSLQVHATTYPLNQTVKTLKSTMGDVFGDSISLSFDKSSNPVMIGSGCVAQVLKGSLKTSKGQSRDIVMKVVHPDIKASIEADIEIMSFITSIIECFPSMRTLSLNECVIEFADLMNNQLDMNVEAKHLKLFRKNFQSKNQSLLSNSVSVSPIIFPEPFDEYTSNDILIESFEGGKPMTDMMSESLEVRHELALLGLHAILKMVFEDNFIHAGNSCISSLCI